MLRTCLLTAVAFGITFPLAAAETPKLTVKADTAEAPKELKPAIKALLDGPVLAVSDAKGAVCTFWLRKEIPSKATAENLKAGLNYRVIPPSTVIGAVKLAKPWLDYHNQEIAAGVYTLRLAIQPADGNHQGTAPYNEFVLLCPAEKDEKPDLMTPKAMVALSSGATGGTHPAVMLLHPNPKPEATPAVADRGKGFFAITLKGTVIALDKPAELGFSFIVVGTATDEFAPQATIQTLAHKCARVTSFFECVGL